MTQDVLREVRSRRMKMTRSKKQLGLREGTGEKDCIDPQAPQKNPSMTNRGRNHYPDPRRKG